MTDLEPLLLVQEHDTHADQLRHRRAALPERERVAGLEADLAEVAASTAEAEKRRHDLVADQRRREDELATLEEKLKKVETAMYGTTGAGRELQAMQEEVDGMKGRISTIEDAVLELLDLLEPLQADLDALGSRRTELEQELEAERVALAAVEAEIDAELEATEAARSAAAAGIPAALLEEYVRLRGRFGGVGAARLSGNRCEGCHLTMAAAEIDRIRHAAPDEVVHCEECGRILVR